MPGRCPICLILHSGASSPAIPARCRRWRSLRTAAGWPPPAPTKRAGAGARALARDGSWLATAGADGTARIWDAVTGRPRATLTGHTGWVQAVAIAPDGSWLATGGADKTVRIWDAVTGQPRAVSSVAIAP